MRSSRNDGFLDKFVGDEVVATFVPLLTGEQHAIRAVDAARALMKATVATAAATGRGCHWVPVSTPGRPGWARWAMAPPRT